MFMKTAILCQLENGNTVVKYPSTILEVLGPILHLWFIEGTPPSHTHTYKHEKGKKTQKKHHYYLPAFSQFLWGAILDKDPF